MSSNNLAAGQGIWAYWHREEFLKRYGSMKVTSGELGLVLKVWVRDRVSQI
jgi:hypothetical protein